MLLASPLLAWIHHHFPGSSLNSPTCSPTPGQWVSTFGYRADPYTGRQRLHQGVDIAAPEGAPVYALARGQVVFAGWLPGYGQTVDVAYNAVLEGQTSRNPLTSRYAHLSNIGVQLHQVVQPCQAIANVGHTGRATGPHLHVELRDGSVVLNPQPILAIRKSIAISNDTDHPLNSLLCSPLLAGFSFISLLVLVLLSLGHGLTLFNQRLEQSLLPPQSQANTFVLKPPLHPRSLSPIKGPTVKATFPVLPLSTPSPFYKTNPSLRFKPKQGSSPPGRKVTVASGPPSKRTQSQRTPKPADLPLWSPKKAPVLIFKTGTVDF